MKKGFTLIEMLAVVTIISILAVIVTANIMGIVRDANETLDDASKTILYTASERYIENIASREGSYTVTVSTLLKNDLITSSFVESNGIQENACVLVTVTSDKNTYEYKPNCD